MFKEKSIFKLILVKWLVNIDFPEHELCFNVKYISTEEYEFHSSKKSRYIITHSLGSYGITRGLGSNYIHQICLQDVVTYYNSLFFKLKKLIIIIVKYHMMLLFILWHSMSVCWHFRNRLKTYIFLYSLIFTSFSQNKTLTLPWLAELHHSKSTGFKKM